MISKQALQTLFKEKGIPKYRVKQVLHAIYKEGKSDFESISVIPKNLREDLKEFPILCFEVASEVSSAPGSTTKTLFRLKDDNCVEGVLMKFKDGRNSVCVSSQVGCGLKCAFCATGAMGFTRNLKAEEIADCVLYFNQILKKEKVTHVVFMGMGEPMLNYDEMMKAVHILNDPDYLGIAARHITISTSGVVPGIEKLSNEDIQVNLAVSIHAPNQTLREKLLPIAKAYKLPELMKAIESYIQKTHRRVSYEYVMLNGINDSVVLAKELASLIRGQMCHVNLIPYNETYLGFKNAGKTKIGAFKKILASFDIPVTVRVSLGQDISAACGQLGNR